MDNENKKDLILMEKLQIFFISLLNNYSVEIATKRALFFFAVNSYVLIVILFNILIPFDLTIPQALFIIIISWLPAIIFLSDLEPKFNKPSIFFGYLIFATLFPFFNVFDTAISVLFFVSLKDMTIKKIKLFSSCLLFNLFLSFVNNLKYSKNLLKSENLKLKSNSLNFIPPKIAFLFLILISLFFVSLIKTKTKKQKNLNILIMFFISLIFYVFL